MKYNSNNNNNNNNGYILLENCNFKISASNFLFSLSKHVKKAVLFFVVM
jgi:hypothetical protein